MQLNLLPAPKSLTRAPGSFKIPDNLYLVLDPHPATRDLFAAESFALDAEPLTHAQIHITHGTGVDPASEIRVTFNDTLAPNLPSEIRDQAYQLDISPTAITLAARSPAGTFYALQTLLQIIRETAYSQSSSKKIKNPPPLKLPCLSISDHPDFPRRGFYHDTARGKVPTVDTLLQLIDDLGHLKYNEFQLYIENNFQFRKFPEMYDDTTPLTAEEISLLDAACKARHIDFVPSLTSLGHFERILGRPKFRHLAEAEPAFLKANNLTCWSDTPWSLAVSDPAAKQFLADMYAEFAPNFSSQQFNICCDEAYDLGTSRSKEQADKVGTGQLYIDWIRYCADLARSHNNKSIQIWGDIILNHPDLIPQLPADTTLLEWGYEHDHKFDEHCQTIAQRLKENAPPPNSPQETTNSAQKTANSDQKNLKTSTSRSFYVSPGTSSWLTLSSRSKNAFGNIHSAATAGLKHGASGLLLTDWGDQGHQQLLAVSLTPIAYSAAASWNLAATPNPADPKHHKPTLQKLLTAISLHLFQDSSAQLAPLAYDLGLTYERLGWQRFNASLDHFLFREYWDFANYVNRAPEKALKQTIAATQSLLTQLPKIPFDHPDQELLTAEFTFTCRIILHTCNRTLMRQQWLAADPKKRNPEDPTRRDLPPKPLPKSFSSQMKTMEKEIRLLEKQFSNLWRTRNKTSRLADVTAEFQRLATEYRRFAKP